MFFRQPVTNFRRVYRESIVPEINWDHSQSCGKVTTVSCPRRGRLERKLRPQLLHDPWWTFEMSVFGTLFLNILVAVRRIASLHRSNYIFFYLWNSFIFHVSLETDNEFWTQSVNRFQKSKGQVPEDVFFLTIIINMIFFFSILFV